MKENVGNTDRLIRVAVATALGAAGVRWLQKNKKRRKNGKTLAPAAAFLAGSAALLESAVTRVCPVNGLLGIDTRSGERKRKDEKKRDESPDEHDAGDLISARAGEAASAAAAH